MLLPHRDPEQDKPDTENEWMDDYIMSSAPLKLY